jgi:hypothetical protein
MKANHGLGLTVLVGLVSLIGLLGSSVKADFTFGKPQNLGPAVNSSSAEMAPSISADGLSLYFASDRAGGSGEYDLWVSTRPSKDAAWGPAMNLGPSVNSQYTEMDPSISSDNLSLYFSDPHNGMGFGRPRPGGFAAGDGGNVWVVTRATVNDPWCVPVNLGSALNSRTYVQVVQPSVSADGLSLYVHACDKGIGVARRASTVEPFGTPELLGFPGNQGANDWWPNISPDERILFITVWSWTSMDFQLWVTRRPTAESGFGLSTRLPASINVPGSWVLCPSLSADGSTLYFCSTQLGGLGGRDLWQAPVISIVDFNGDGKVDAIDLGLLTENWGLNQPLYDIGPFAWGDGVVDERDLRVMMESLMTPGPHASDVPCDVVLSWIFPSFAPACDVYFGTSFEAVNNADRTDPCGVLVNQGQTAATYDPEGFLEFTKTYYWRVDFVSAEPNSIVYKGPVLQFTTEAAIYPIRSLVAAASSSTPGAGPEKTIDGSGLDANDLHSTELKDMWWSKSEALHWIQYEFDRVYKLHEMWVWNHNMPVEPSIGFGAKTVQIEYSADGTTWTTLDGVPEFARAPGQSGYAASTTVSFGGASAKFVKLTITKNWGTTQQTGLSEVRFYAMSAASVTEP